ncbi:MAG: helix-turn-helix domain-containing protein [Clostridia bacterium]|nr:helix-turn-helix domain-containing protein [Clostridia bacterium]
MTTIGEQIRKLRKQNGMSQDELGYKIGVSRQAVSQWETNSLTPRSDKIKAMCELFGVSSDYFLQNAENSVKKEEQTSVKQKRVSRLAVIITAVLSAVILLAVTLCLCLYIYPREGDETVASVDFGLTHNEIAVVLIILAVIIIALNVFLIIKCVRNAKLDKMQG